MASALVPGSGPFAELLLAGGLASTLFRVALGGRQAEHSCAAVVFWLLASALFGVAGGRERTQNRGAAVLREPGRVRRVHARARFGVALGAEPAANPGAAVDFNRAVLDGLDASELILASASFAIAQLPRPAALVSAAVPVSPAAATASGFFGENESSQGQN